jgi:isopenicillin-N N-acyltransferase like protein
LQKYQKFQKITKNEINTFHPPAALMPIFRTQHHRNSNKMPWFSKRAPNQLQRTNGHKNSKERIQNVSGGSDVPVVHLYGTPYEQGFAQGELLYQEIQDLMPSFYGFMIDEVGGLIHQYAEWIPDFILTPFLNWLLRKLIDIEYWFVQDYIHDDYVQEMQGLADATGIEYIEFRRLSLMPETAGMYCSIMGAFGKATADFGGGMIQLRALGRIILLKIKYNLFIDYAPWSGLQKWGVVLVYHPNRGHPYALSTWAGFVGAITGYSSKKVGMSEIVFGNPPSKMGIPTTYLMRDILQFDDTAEEAVERIKQVRRTSHVWLGIGDPKKLYIIDYADALVYDWKNYTHYGHPIREGLLYCTDFETGCFEELIPDFYGNITAINTLRYLIPKEASGDMQVAVYDMDANAMYIANASPLDEDGNFKNAYEQPYLYLDMSKLFSVPPPKMGNLRH